MAKASDTISSASREPDPQAEKGPLRERVEKAVAAALAFDDVAEKPIRRGPGDWVTATAAVTDAVVSDLVPVLADMLSEARADVLREHADREVALWGHGTSAVERLLEHAHEHDGRLGTPPGNKRGGESER